VSARTRVLDTIKAWADRFRAQLMTLWFCRSHPRTPLTAKILAALVLAYAFSPIDLIPDFIPVLGYLDDLLIVPAGIYLALRLIPDDVVAESRQRAQAWLAQRQARPRNYVAGACIVAFWLACLYFAWSLFR
jgi:uncharacterized membrane protein YkvA (DUF1232 family)